MAGPLFPPVEPYEAGMLEVDDLHSIYWEQCGNPAGVPVVSLHGGPGGATGPVCRQYFDPDFYRFIYFHQRGAGKSTPLGETRNNTTDHLIGDIECLRRHLKVEQWLVTGGSWGSTLALAYAEAHPDRCLGLLLRGIFLAREHDLDWFFMAAHYTFPDVWDAFVNFLPEQERTDLIANYRRRILDPDPDVHLPAVRSWCAYELSTCMLVPGPETLELMEQPEFVIPYARMNAHYFANGCFMVDKPILENIQRIEHLPGIIVHGRYDMSVPLRQATELASRWPKVELVVVPDGGHAFMDKAITAALIEAQEKMKSFLAKP